MLLSFTKLSLLPSFTPQSRRLRPSTQPCDGTSVCRSIGCASPSESQPRSAESAAKVPPSPQASESLDTVALTTQPFQTPLLALRLKLLVCTDTGLAKSARVSCYPNGDRRVEIERRRTAPTLGFLAQGHVTLKWFPRPQGTSGTGLFHKGNLAHNVRCQPPGV